eukprot:CAMPEP_0172492794 /NCGR_PEP_ID=MMETSP1066-20121228/24039_1 /TAXON_ID=671091 /ORGANISM="Coscinodiscus wailesii, Strain CCMP2513" /LENGTH=1262 /DNA_ID=CAMNT_0013262605 /DNA_START=314 /DNA_END=4102 /DNA_ORIENTATION=+
MLSSSRGNSSSTATTLTSPDILSTNNNLPAPMPRHGSGVHTPPPGFGTPDLQRHSSSGGNNKYAHSHGVQHYGESIRGSTLSAPPPGFHDLGGNPSAMSGDTARAAANASTAVSDNFSTDVGGSHSKNLRDDHRVLRCANESTANARVMNYAGFVDDSDKRTTSFANLAALLGEGLVVSMDDSFSDRTGVIPPGMISNQIRQNLYYGAVDRGQSKRPGRSSPEQFSSQNVNNADLHHHPSSQTSQNQALPPSSSVPTKTSGDSPSSHTTLSRGGVPADSNTSGHAIIAKDTGIITSHNHDNYYLQQLIDDSQKRESQSLSVITTTARHTTSYETSSSCTPTPQPVSASTTSPATVTTESMTSSDNTAPHAAHHHWLTTSKEQIPNQHEYQTSSTQRQSNFGRSSNQKRSGSFDNLHKIIDLNRASSSSAPPNIADVSSIAASAGVGASGMALSQQHHHHGHGHGTLVPLALAHRGTHQSTPSPMPQTPSPHPVVLHHTGGVAGAHVLTGGKSGGGATLPLSSLSGSGGGETMAASELALAIHSSSGAERHADTASLDAAIIEREREAEQEVSCFLRDVIGPGHSGASAEQSRSGISRGLAVLGASCLDTSGGALTVKDIRSLCEAFGTLESFRADFLATKGVLFLSYYDLRSAQHAAVELCRQLVRLATLEGLRGSDRIHVKYCIPLNFSAISDESTILLSNLSRDVDEDRLSIIMASYGDVRSVNYQVQTESYNSNNLDDERVSYVVEFYDIQDARQALLEIETTQPWGPEVRVGMGMRNPSKRRQGRDILALVGRWRHGERTSGGKYQRDNSNVIAPQPTVISKSPPPPRVLPVPLFPPSATVNHSVSRASSASGSPMPRSSSPAAATYQNIVYQQYPGAAYQGTLLRDHSPHHSQSTSPAPDSSSHRQPQPQQPQQAQLVISPDGQYSYMIPQTSQQHHHSHIPIRHHNVYSQGPHGTYVTSIPISDHHPSYYSHHTAATAAQHQPPYGMPAHHVIVTAPPYIDLRQGGTTTGTTGMPYPMNAVPLFTTAPAMPPQMQQQPLHGVSAPTTGETADSKGSGGDAKKGGHYGKHHQGEDDVNLSLNLAAVSDGSDTRTSVMVRNIPNKYTQKMLLAEFAEYGHGSDKIDFFYLPIDFKNKCNRGYAFINFVNYRDIIHFHEQYNGQHWKIFNSDKICNITYARIQGKAAMLKRFEHSALLDKDDEYRPLVFVSHGANKGQREAFPNVNSGAGSGVTSVGNEMSSLRAAMAPSSTPSQTKNH